MTAPMTAPMTDPSATPAPTLAEGARADHTLVVSDLHLTEFEAQDPSRPLWKRHKHADLALDDSFARLLEAVRSRIPGEIELILNGDTFDFDAVLALPPHPPWPVSWLERRRGLAPEEPRSRFKLHAILRDHPVAVRALREWVLAGHRLVVVVGNHDAELYWPKVREDLCAALDLPPDRREAVRFCEWCYLSNGDTLVEHGNQYDAYCVCPDPLHPFVRVGGRVRVHVPFGDLAGRYLLNGMGLFNPYVESTFIKPLWEYLTFFFTTVARVQPLLMITWFWGAVATLVVSLRQGFAPSVRDPLTLEAREADAAARSNTTPGVLRALRELRVHPAAWSPWMVVRELWLDRALLLAVMVFACVQVVLFLNLFEPFSAWWGLVPFAVLLPPFGFYARSVSSEVANTTRALRRRIGTALRLTGVQRLIIGHTHVEGHWVRNGQELLNTGTWSVAFEDAACTRPFGRRCFAWIRPDPSGPGRVAELLEWRDPVYTPIPSQDDPPEPGPGWRELTRRLPAMALRRLRRPRA